MNDMKSMIIGRKAMTLQDTNDHCNVNGHWQEVNKHCREINDDWEEVNDH